MTEYLEQAPQNWKHGLVLPAVPKDGSPYEDSFTVAVDRPVSYWNQIYTVLQDPQVEVEAFFSEGRIIASVALRTRVSAPCSRCLEPAEADVSGQLRYIFSLRREQHAKDEPEEMRDGEEEIIELDSWEDEIDLGQMIWETLITALPAALVCSNECLGLCTQCGANLNKGPCGCKKETKDPRFDILRNLMQDDHK
ncbi:MAG: DUF177 domain-containing protein [Cloacibacillus sp.]